MKYFLLLSLALLSLVATGAIGLTMTSGHDYGMWNGGHGMMEDCDDMHDEMQDQCEEDHEEICEDLTTDECEEIGEDCEGHMDDHCEHEEA